MKCCVCGRDWPETQSHVLTLTEDEKKAILSMGHEPPDTYVYCKPCWRVLSDKLMGAQLIKGVVQGQLKANGVIGAEQTAQEFFKHILKLERKP